MPRGTLSTRKLMDKRSFCWSGSNYNLIPMDFCCGNGWCSFYLSKRRWKIRSLCEQEKAVSLRETCWNAIQCHCVIYNVHLFGNLVHSFWASLWSLDCHVKEMFPVVLRRLLTDGHFRTVNNSKIRPRYCRPPGRWRARISRHFLCVTTFKTVMFAFYNRIW